MLLSSCEGVLPKLLVVSLLLATGRHLFLLEGGEATSVSAVLLLSQVNRRVLLLFEFISCSIDALLTQHGQNLGNVLSDLLDLGQLDLRL